MDLTFSSALQSSLGRWSEIWTMSMTDKYCYLPNAIHLSTRPYYVLNAIACCVVLSMSALISFVPLGNPAPFASLNIKGSFMHIFSIGSTFRVTVTYHSRSILCFSLYLKICKKMLQNMKIAFGGLQMLNNFVSETHWVRVSSHSAHI